ncbi:glycoprotein [Arabis alpina]|uniref:Glycoprotein n=1 Tax=Arabis alpina TaxID=50452 RepID=A0A087FXB0_ARAAL|nr:glycoprotein [Arabis alpina]
MVETRNSKKIKEDQNPRKFYSQFLFKAIILAVFCSVVPVFLSQSPELSNQTRLLELLHLIFVGIAVSYGLFSRRNYDGGGGKTNNDHKSDHNSYVPKILEVPSSVFNVHQETESEPSDDSSGDYTKIQTWKNKHHMNIPDIVLSKDHEREKPLLLPVRSLNHSLQVSHSGENSGRWEKVRSKRKLLKNLVDDDNSDVLPSPIPWRSRSSSSSSSTEIESQPSVKNQTTVELKPLIKTQANMTSSPRKLTPLPELAKSAEDIARRHNFHGEFHPPPSPPPPPPPPPPPLPAFYRSKSRESAHKKKFVDGEFHPPPPPPPPPPVDYYKSPPTKLRVSRKLSEHKMKLSDKTQRNSLKKVWWSDPIVESKEHGVIRQETEKNSYLESKKTVESEDEEHRRRDSEVHGNDEIKEKKIIEEGVSESNNGSDVDKKADVFIAKVREQIRLQRIESIKRSANEISSNSSR